MEAVGRRLFLRGAAIRIVLLLVLVIATSLAIVRRPANFQADGLKSTTPRAAQDFVRSIGFTTHLTYTDYKSNAYFTDVFNSIVKPKLRDLGVYHIRQYPGETDSNFPPLVAKFNELANPPAGYPSISFNFETHVDPSVSSNPQNNCYLPKMKYIWFGTLSNCHNLGNYTATSSVRAVSVENPNEPDHCASYNCNYSPSSSNWYAYSLQQNPNWPDDVLQAAEALYTKLATDPQTSNLERLAPSFVWLQHHQNETYNGTNLRTYLEPLKAHITHGNAHPYCNLQTVAACFSQQVQPIVDHYSPKPVIVTETGHSTGEFTELQQAKYLLRILFDFFERGIPRTYIYELLDEPSAATTKEKNFGLINEDGREKPAFVWLKNALTLLKDSGTVALDPLPLNVTGTSVRSTLLRKSDRSYWLALHYDKSNTVDADVTTAATVSFATPMNVALYNMETLNPYAAISELTSFNLNVPDRAILLKITEPAVAGTGSTGGSSTGTTGGSGSNKANSTTNNSQNSTEETPASPETNPVVEPDGFSLEAISRRVNDNPLLGWAAAGLIITLLGASWLIVRTLRLRTAKK